MQIKLEVSKETASYVAEMMELINKLDADTMVEVVEVKKQIEQAVQDNDDWKFHDVDTMCDQLLYILTSNGDNDQVIANYFIDHIEFRNLWQDLLLQVGEAMGPFCYMAFKLERFIADSPDDEVIGNCITPKTVRDIVSFYEERWAF